MNQDFNGIASAEAKLAVTQTNDARRARLNHPDGRPSTEAHFLKPVRLLVLAENRRDFRGMTARQKVQREKLRLLRPGR